jgi:hypothetical protein
MVIINRVAILVLLMLCATAEATQFEILPKFCLISEHDTCDTTLQIHWRTENVACLRNETTQEILHCAPAETTYRITLHSKETVRFSLIDQGSQKVLATSEFKVLLHQPQALQERRLSWSIFR